MSGWGKEVSPETVIGGTIVSFETWGPITVQGSDGLEYTIRVLEGHSGPENCVFETPSSIAKRGAKTRRERPL